MRLKQPFMISGRLLPALPIGEGTLSYDYETFVFYLDTPEFEYVIDKYKPGLGAKNNVQRAFEDVLDFISIAIDEACRSHSEGEEPEYDLFPKHVVDWFTLNEAEIGELIFLINDEELIS